MKRFGRLALNESEIVRVVASEEETDRTIARKQAPGNRTFVTSHVDCRR